MKKKTLKKDQLDSCYHLEDSTTFFLSKSSWLYPEHNIVFCLTKIISFDWWNIDLPRKENNLIKYAFQIPKLKFWIYTTARTYSINSNRTMLWCTYHPLYNIVYNAGSKSSEQFSRCCSSQEMTLSDKQRWTTPCQKLTHMDWHWPPKRFLSVSWCHLELTRCQIYEVKLLWCYWMADWLTWSFFSYKV